MNKKLTAVIIACLSMIAVSGQTLFTYGKYSVDAKDFIKAYNKNNTQPVVNKAKAISDYLDLYIKSRLKIREAYDRKYDTLAQIKTEVENLRIQISESYMNDPEMIKRMQQEAFNRSQKDIRVAHIFISSKNATGFMDSTAARLKKEEVLNRLQKGEDFLQVAQQLSDDPAAKTTKGELGELKQAELSGDQAHIAEEFGDVLFALINYARYIDVDPESALESINQKFIRRFNYIEEKAGESFDGMGLEAMDALWNEAKSKGL